MRVQTPWNDEQINFLREYVPGHTRKELTEEYNRRFPNAPRSLSALTAKYKFLGLKTGHTGLFTKGRAAKRTKAIGSLVFKQGKAHVKVADRKIKRLSHFVWEGAGREIPEGYTLAFVNGDCNDCRLENMRLVTLGEYQLLCSREYTGEYAGELFDSTLAWVRLRRLTRKVARGEKIPPRTPQKGRKCPSCGQVLYHGEYCTCYFDVRHQRRQKQRLESMKNKGEK